MIKRGLLGFLGGGAVGYSYHLLMVRMSTG